MFIQQNLIKRDGFDLEMTPNESNRPNFSCKWPSFDKNDPIIRVKFETSQRTMTKDASLSWEDYLKRKDSTGSPGDDQIIIPIMWFKQTARMQWSFYKNMLLSAIIPLKILLNSNLILYIVSLVIIFFTVPFISKRTSTQYQPLSEADPSSDDSEAPEELPGLESSIPEENWKKAKIQIFMLVQLNSKTPNKIFLHKLQNFSSKCAIFTVKSQFYVIFG